MTCFEVRNEFPLSQRVLEIITWEKVRFKAQTSYFRKIENLGSSEYSTAVEYSTRRPILIFWELFWRCLNLERFLKLSAHVGWLGALRYLSRLSKTHLVHLIQAQRFLVYLANTPTLYNLQNTPRSLHSLQLLMPTVYILICMPCTKWHVLRLEMNSHYLSEFLG